MSLPTNRIPTADEVVNWASSIIGQRIDVPGSGYGAQCWDLPNYLFYKIWGFKTPGNARDIPFYNNYPRGFQIIRNTPEFIPEPGDIAVWTAESDPWIRWGHTDIVIGPSTKDYFWGVDQNWFDVNENYGSPAAKVKHSYYGVTHFVRPPYTKSSQSDVKSVENRETLSNNKSTKVINKISFTTSILEKKKTETLSHYIVEGKKRSSKPSKILIKNRDSVLNTLELYKYRDTLNSNDISHFYIDRNYIWESRAMDFDVPNYENCIVIEINETRNIISSHFLMNEITTMVKIKEICDRYKLPFNKNTIQIDNKAWKTIEFHVGKKIKEESDLKFKDKTDAVKELIEIYNMRNELLNSHTKDVLIPVTINISQETSNKINSSGNKVENVVSKYTLSEALNIQFSLNPPPQTNNGYTWYGASRDQTSRAMNTNLIFNDNVQKYQLLKLNQFQGISVDKLNQILNGKGTLSGKGQSFSEAGRNSGVNEIYLIAHAFLESNYGRSNYASGSYGVYNYFGIGAFDNNPDNAIDFARNHGWTSPDSAIKGGAKFVGRSYFDVGQNTLYRMRWNPLKPGQHQYATDISWAKVQAQIISELYNKIGLTGEFYIYDKYR